MKAELKKVGQQVLLPLLAIIVALMIGAVFMWFVGKNPLVAYGTMFYGAFGSWINFGETLVYITPLIFAGLAVALAFRGGLFNIGVEGQIIVAMLVAAWVGASWTGLPTWLHGLATLIMGGLAGAIWAGIPGACKAYRGVHEVISSIMMNWIALFLTHYFVMGPLLAPPGTIPATREIADVTKFLRFLPPSRANLGIFIALICVALVYLLLWRTPLGFSIRAVGKNPEAAHYAGIHVERNLLYAMLLSGGLSGLAGACQVQGLQYKFLDVFMFTGYGFDGIAVALLGRNHPVGVILGALLFGSLTSGALQMQSVAGIPKEVIGIIQAVIILFVAGDEGIRRWVLPWLQRRRETAQGGATHGVA